MTIREMGRCLEQLETLNIKLGVKTEISKVHRWVIGQYRTNMSLYRELILDGRAVGRLKKYNSVYEGSAQLFEIEGEISDKLNELDEFLDSSAEEKYNRAHMFEGTQDA